MNAIRQKTKSHGMNLDRQPGRRHHGKQRQAERIEGQEAATQTGTGRQITLPAPCAGWDKSTKDLIHPGLMRPMAGYPAGSLALAATRPALRTFLDLRTFRYGIQPQALRHDWIACTSRIALAGYAAAIETFTPVL